MYVFANGQQISEMCGIPALSLDTQFVLHLWNKNNFLPALNIFDLWETYASFKDLLLPPAVDALCRFGDPFQGGTNAIIRYEAGIGTDKQTADVVDFREVSLI